MAKSLSARAKLEKHLEELEEMKENTSGGAHDSITFAGKGLNFLKSLVGLKEEKLAKKSSKEDDEDEDDEDEDEMEKNEKNGGDYEEEEEDPDDPAENGDNIFTNKGKKIPKNSLKQAVTKNAKKEDKKPLEKSLKDLDLEYEDVLDAAPYLKELSHHVRTMAKNTSAGMTELQDSVLILTKGLEQSLKAQAALAKDLELIKKQPVTNPATGFVVLNKQQGSNERRMSKSEVEDILTDYMNDGHEEAPLLLKKLGSIRSDVELKTFVENLPSDIEL